MRLGMISIFLTFSIMVQASGYEGMDLMEKADSLRLAGVDAKNKGNYDEALAILDESLKIYISLGDSSGIADVLNNIGTTFSRKGDKVKAIENLLRAIAINENVGNYESLAKNYMNAGNVYFQENYLEEALDYYTKCAELSDKIKNTRILANVYFSMGGLHSRKGAVFYDLPKAETEYKRALDLYKELGNQDGINATIGNLAILYENQGNLELALSFYLQSLEGERKSGTVSNIIVSLNNVGLFYIRAYGKPEKAVPYLKEGLQLSKDSKDASHYLGFLSQLLQVKMAIGDTVDNRLLFAELMVMRDSVYNIEKQRQLAELYAMYDNEKKQDQIVQQNEIIKAKTSVQYMLLGILLSIVIICVLVFFYFRARLTFLKEIRIKEEHIHHSELENLKKEHQVKELNLLVETQEKERRRIAEDLHDRLGGKLAAVKLMVSSLNPKSISEVPKVLTEVISEVREISHDLHSGVLHKLGLRYALAEIMSKIEETGLYEVFLECEEFESRLPFNVEKGIFMIAQELISNTVRHSGANKLTLQILRYPEKTLSIIYEDNGRGFEIGSNKTEGGLGLRNIKSRVANLGGTMQIDSVQGRGSTFIFEIPLL